MSIGSIARDGLISYRLIISLPDTMLSDTMLLDISSSDISLSDTVSSDILSPDILPSDNLFSIGCIAPTLYRSIYLHPQYRYTTLFIASLQPSFFFRNCQIVYVVIIEVKPFPSRAVSLYSLSCTTRRTVTTIRRSGRKQFTAYFTIYIPHRCYSLLYWFIR